MAQEGCLAGFLIRRPLTNDALPPRAIAESGNSAGQATSGVTMGCPKEMVWVPVVAPFLWSPAYEAVTMSFPVVAVGRSPYSARSLRPDSGVLRFPCCSGP